MKPPGKLGILGIGNPLREDDGLGSWIAGKISELPLSGVSVVQAQCLQTEMLAELSAFETLVLIDASLDVQKVIFQPLQGITLPEWSNSHDLDCRLLPALFQVLELPTPSLYLCSIPAYQFGFRNDLSAPARKQALLAFSKIRAWLQAGGYLASASEIPSKGTV